MAPAFQLVRGDRYNIFLGLFAVFAMASAKDCEGLHPLVNWSVRAYTNWNLSLIGVRLLLKQGQWDPFLLCNSVSIFVGFRTAMAQGLDEHVRRRVASLGLDLPRPAFKLIDHACHTLPVVCLAGALMRRRSRVGTMNTAYVLALLTWFAFRQQAKLDSSSIYTPHPWRRAWWALFSGAILTPPLFNALLDRRQARAALYGLALALPYLSTRLDPHLLRKYRFDFALEQSLERQSLRQQKPHRQHAEGDAAPCRRVQSESALCTST